MKEKLSPNTNTERAPLNFFYVCLWSYNLIFIIVAFIICITLSAFYGWYIVYGMLIHVPFALLGCGLTMVFNNLSFKATKTKSKGLASFASFALEIVKYLIVLLGLIIGLIVNTTTDHQYFNYISLACCTLIYPCGNLIGLLHYAIGTKKKD